MGDPRQRLKRQSHSKSRKRRKGFTLYLCHNLDYDDVAAALDRAGIRYKRHRDYFKGSTSDETLLPFVGKKRWILVTFDQKQRTRNIEKELIKQYSVRQFVFTSGDIPDPGEVLVKARRAMKRACSGSDGPFCYAISGKAQLAPRSLD